MCFACTKRTRQKEVPSLVLSLSLAFQLEFALPLALALEVAQPERRTVYASGRPSGGFSD